MTQQELIYALEMIGAFVFIMLGLAKGSDWTKKLLSMSWEDVLVLIGAVATLLLQVLPLMPSVPAWVPVVLAIVIKAIKDMHTTTASPQFRRS